MSKYCPDINCDFYDEIPNGSTKLKACPYCSAILISEKPPPTDQIAEHSPVLEPLLESVENPLFVNSLSLDIPKPPAHKPTNVPTDNVIVTFYTAILRRHFKSNYPPISIRFDNSSIIVEYNKDAFELEYSKYAEYGGSTYALLTNSIKIPSKILDSCKSDDNLIIPYKYYINGQEETVCSKKGATHRGLVLHCSHFYLPNLIEKYDMLILPPNLATEDQWYYSDYTDSWSIIFNLYNPIFTLPKEGTSLKFKKVKEHLGTVLHSLCYSFLCKAPKFPSFSKMKHFLNDSTNEDVSNAMCRLVYNWIDTTMQTDLPVHLKFYLAFLCLDNDLMQEFSGEIYTMVFHDINYKFVLSIIEEKSERNLFLEYQTEIRASPQLLHSAMSRVSDSLMLSLPLYHILFNSEQDFEQAHSTHSFLDNAYWGLPAGIQFKHSPKIELSKIIDALSKLNEVSPILIYSITLLYLRLDLFFKLIAIIGIPFLPFFSVLLYRIEKWSLLTEDTQLRESVFNTYLTQSVQTPNFMSQEHICQASDVIFQMVQLIMGSRDIPNISYKEACLLLQVIARLLTVYDGYDLLSEQRIHEAQSKILNLVPSSVLIRSIEQCVDEEMLNKLSQCNNKCIDQVTVWNALYSIQFPSSYGWIDSISKEFSELLKFHSLQCLLTLIANLCCASPETEKSRNVFQDICTKLMQISEASGTRLEDHELIVQSLVGVPENRFSDIINVLAKILVLHEVNINGANPVWHILSVSWYPALFKHCSTHLLGNSIFPDAQALLSFSIDTIRKLDSDFQALTITVKHLKLIIEYKPTYLLLLDCLPATTVWDETTYNATVETINYFLHQHSLITDLKRLLDSTNYGIYSTEILDFLAIDYNSKSISFLCSSEAKEFALIPGDVRFDSFNRSPIKNMLETLPDLLQSHFLKSQFKHHLISYLQQTERKLEINVDIIYAQLWLPVLIEVSITLSRLFNMTIKLNAVKEHFGIYSNCPEQINDEISHVIRVLQTIGKYYDRTEFNQPLEKVIWYFRLQTIEKLVIHILQVKNAYKFTGSFSSIESIYNIQLNIEDRHLSSITNEFLTTEAILSDLTELHLEILRTLDYCVELFTWTAGVLDGPADLDNLTDLALNSVDSTCFQVNRITSFKDVCTLFMPFIIDVKAVDQQCFLTKLKSVHDTLQDTNRSQGLLKMSRDCAKGSELEFWKELKQAHTSIGEKTISQLRGIMQFGNFILSTSSNTRNISDILKLRVCCKSSTQADQVYNLEVLRGMQSNIILITPLMHEDKGSGKFVAILEEVIVLADLFLQMHTSGNIYFRELTNIYSCHSIDSVKQDIAFLRDECKQWTAQLIKARDNNYLLNYFTASQIVKIQVGLEAMDRGNDLNRDTFHLLTLVSEQLSQRDIENAYNRVKRDVSLPQRTKNSFENSGDFSMIGSITQDRPRYLIRTDDNGNKTTLTSIKEKYHAAKKPKYTLNDVGVFIYHLSSNRVRNVILLPSFLKDNEPNVIFVQKSNLLTYVLSLYVLLRSDFPSHHEVLICSEHTTTEEVDIFWRRALNSPLSSEIFCLAFIENMRYEIALQSITSLKKYLQLKHKRIEFRLVLLCSLESKHSSYTATALAQYERIHTKLNNTEKLKEFVFQIIKQIDKSPSESPYLPIEPSSVIDPDRCCVRIISSQSAGSGKSLTVSRLVDKLKGIANVPLSATMWTTINLFESQSCEYKAATKLIESQTYTSPYGSICHLDLIATSYEELIPFLFKLLITGVICDEYGSIWRCSKINYYVIEITLSTQSPEVIDFLALFPDWQCLDPKTTLEYMKKDEKPATQMSLFDQKEMESPEYQRVYAYVHKLESKQESQTIDAYSYEPSDKCENAVELLSLLLKKYCSIDKPTWSVLKHFISFLNSQLVACENNIYCLEKGWKGLKTFLVECMILMSRDFSTPSLKNSLEEPPTDLIQGYCIEARRKWEGKNHPYIFLNEDGHSMTFFGIYITEQLDQLDAFDAKRVIGKKVFPKELYKILKHNKVDLEEDYSTWDRNKMITILSNVMDKRSVLQTDTVFSYDPCYVLTVDNLKKMLAIHMRFRCNIPVIIMGETGCGKTRLINFMCKLQAKRRDIENLVVLRVHGETTRQDILNSYEKALKLARNNIVNDVDTILFFDETNTSPMIGFIKEILCDRRIDGNHIPSDIRLQFIAACNPYRKHTREMIYKLSSAGLGIITGDKMAREHFGDIPLRDLVYRVIPLPQSLLPLVWDFGKLGSETENSYIIEIINVHLTGETFKKLGEFCNPISKVLSAVQEYMRERKDECSFVSLRDVERTVRVMRWFHELIPKLHLEPTDMSLLTYSLILSVSVCYRAKLKDRSAFDTCLIANIVPPLSPITEASIIGKEIDRCQTCIVNLMKIPDHIARNAALKENLFMMYVCIQLKIPLFIIGKPGSSKSLARSIINHSINEGILVGGSKIAEYTHIYMQCYQCSQYTTSKEISDLFDKCQTIQKEAAPDSVACVVLDEVGLAEDSSNLPLKVLHSLLEDSATSEFAQRGPNVAFIGLSNWALDPAKMNRGIMVQLEDPSKEELVNTAHAIIKPSGQVDDIISERLNLYVRSLAEGYLELCVHEQNRLVSKDYFGLRDFYCLMKMLYSLCKRYDTPLNRGIMIHALKRNFGGIANIDVHEVFNKSLTGLNESEIGPLSDPLSLIRASVDPPLNSESTFDRSRYLLLLTENYVALDILFQSKILNQDTKVIFGSSFPFDKESFNICHNINRIKIHLELGEVVVLTNLSNLYESLYELLNQYYFRLLGKYWVTIGIGSQRVECPVDPRFRLIVVADKTTVYEQFPPPLINRLEKHILTNSTILSGDPVVKKIVEKLTVWIESFVTVVHASTTRSYAQNECFIGIQEGTPSFVVCSTISKLGFKGVESENENEILDASKLELLKLASPDSILRLPRSKLSCEADSISYLYFSLNLFSLSHYLVQLLKVQIDTGPLPILSFITTNSQLLTETDLDELVKNLKVTHKFNYNISNLYLSLFKTEKEFVSCILNEISSVRDDTEDRKIVLIQSTDCNANLDLVSCAKYKIMEIVSEHRNMLNSNFYFLFIVRLLTTKHTSSFAGFCGFPWDSVHIDELRPPYQNLLPDLDVIKDTSVAEIFNFHYQVPDESFIYYNENYIYFKRRRLLRCVQAAVSRLIDPRQSSSEWKTKKINKLSDILSNRGHSDIADLICEKISQLLQRIKIREYSEIWSLLSSLRVDNHTNYPTVMKTLSRYIDSSIEPILAGVLGVIDTLDDLDLAFASDSEIRELWMILFKDDSLFDLEYLISPESLRSSKSYTVEYSMNVPVFSTSFPFFLAVYQQVTRLYDELKLKMGKCQLWKRFEAVFDVSSVGKALKSIKIESKSNPSFLHYKYLKNFVRLQIPQFQDQLYQVVYVMLVVAITNCQRDMREKEGATLNPEDFPDITIPLIHIANDIIRERIAFVKEAYSLGFSLPSDHLIRSKDAIGNSKNYSQFKQIDFDLFACIINRFSKSVSCIYNNSGTKIPIQQIHTCERLIEENIILFHNDFRIELDTLRCSWYATQTLVLFATNIIEIKEFEDLLKSQDLLKSVLSTLKNIVSHENVNFLSSEVFKSILDLLEDMNKRTGKITSKDEQALVGLSQQSELWMMLQVHATRFFHQFLTRIVLRATDRKLPNDLIKEIINLALLNKIDISNTRGINLFRLSNIHPSPELRCLLLELVFRESERDHSSDLVRTQLEQQMSDIYKKIDLKNTTSGDEMAIIVLQSLENTHHHRLAEYLTFEEKLVYIRHLLNDESIYPPLSQSSVSHELLESVAVLRFTVTCLVKWYSALEFKTKYLKSQITSTPTKPTPSNRELMKCFRLLYNMIEQYALHNSVLLFLFKTMYFNTGFGDVLSHPQYRDSKWRFVPQKPVNKNKLLDLFLAVDLDCSEESPSSEERSKDLKKEIKRNIPEQSTLFKIFSVSCAHLMSGEETSQLTKSSVSKTLLQRKPFEDPFGFVAMQKQKLIQHLPPDVEELARLADDISQNRFLNMSQFHISQETHLNTVSIAGLLYHIAMLLHYVKDNKLLRPLTLIHYEPSELRGKYLPAVPHDVLSVKKSRHTIHALTVKAPDYPSRRSSSRVVSRTNAIIHCLGDPIKRTSTPTGIRRLSAISVALLRSIMHCIFIYTLQTKHMLNPTKVTQLVETSGRHTCSEYFFLHLIQDITDVTTIINRTFEEAVLIIHTLIDQLINERDTSIKGPVYLKTEEDLEEWENMFELNFVSRRQLLNNKVLKERMRNVLAGSQHCDITLLRGFYEEGETGFSSKLWRHRNIIGYDHLLQEFSCQFSSTHPLLEKFLNEQPLLSVTKYIPEFVSLQVKLVRKSMCYHKDKKVKDLYISDFLDFIQKEESSEHLDYLNQFKSLRNAGTELKKEKHRLEAFYPQMSVRITNSNTTIGQLVTTSQQGIGILSSLIQLLLIIHNSFIDKYRETFPNIESRTKSTILLSLVTSHHLISYQTHLENLIFSNASQSFLIGEGTLITYDFKGIENDFANRIMLNKLSIGDDLKVDHSEGKLLNIFKRLKLKIQQEEVTEDNWNSIKAELMDPHDISKVLTLLELIINFSSFGEERPQRPIKSYIHEVLKYPNSKGLISKKADETCSLKHLLSLWHNLSIHRAKLSGGSHLFTQVDSCYSTGLDSNQITSLKSRVDTNNIDVLLTMLYDYTLLNLCDQQEQSTPDEKLQDSLLNFSELNSFLSHDNGIISELIPEDILVAHTVSTWKNLLSYSKELQA